MLFFFYIDSAVECTRLFHLLFAQLHWAINILSQQSLLSISAVAVLARHRLPSGWLGYAMRKNNLLGALSLKLAFHLGSWICKELCTEFKEKKKTNLDPKIKPFLNVKAWFLCCPVRQEQQL